jgi:hypothetical protein
LSILLRRLGGKGKRKVEARHLRPAGGGGLILAVPNGRPMA